MRYAADNRVVQTTYAITTGPWRFAFYGVVAAAIALSVYFPVRDLYAAYRTGDILERQLAVRESYNKTLETEVNKLLSTEGIEDAARRNLGLVMPGEHAVEVRLDRSLVGYSVGYPVVRLEQVQGSVGVVDDLVGGLSVSGA